MDAWQKKEYYQILSPFRTPTILDEISMSQLRSRSWSCDLMRRYSCCQHKLITCRLKYNEVLINYIIGLGIELDRKGP